MKPYSYERHMQKVNIKVNLETTKSTKSLPYPTNMHNTRGWMQSNVN